jgi:hypothetical protein
MERIQATAATTFTEIRRAAGKGIGSRNRHLHMTDDEPPTLYTKSAIPIFSEKTSREKALKERERASKFVLQAIGRQFGRLCLKLVLTHIDRAEERFKVKDGACDFNLSNIREMGDVLDRIGGAPRVIESLYSEYSLKFGYHAANNARLRIKEAFGELFENFLKVTEADIRYAFLKELNESFEKAAADALFSPHVEEMFSDRSSLEKAFELHGDLILSEKLFADISSSSIKPSLVLCFLVNACARAQSRRDQIYEDPTDASMAFQSRFAVANGCISGQTPAWADNQTAFDSTTQGIFLLQREAVIQTCKLLFDSADYFKFTDSEQSSIKTCLASAPELKDPLSEEAIEQLTPSVREAIASLRELSWGHLQTALLSRKSKQKKRIQSTRSRALTRKHTSRIDSRRRESLSSSVRIETGMDGGMAATPSEKATRDRCESQPIVLGEAGRIGTVASFSLPSSDRREQLEERAKAPPTEKRRTLSRQSVGRRSNSEKTLQKTPLKSSSQGSQTKPPESRAQHSPQVEESGVFLHTSHLLASALSRHAPEERRPEARRKAQGIAALKRYGEEMNEKERLLRGPPPQIVPPPAPNSGFLPPENLADSSGGGGLAFMLRGVADESMQQVSETPEVSRDPESGDTHEKPPLSDG